MRRRTWRTAAGLFFLVPLVLCLVVSAVPSHYVNTETSAAGMVLAIAAGAACLWIQRRLDARVARNDALRLCRQCGYDLRYSPQRCPECGTPNLWAERRP